MTAPRAAPLAARRPAPAADDVAARLAAGEPVRLELPDGGRLHVDRPMPFLCLHRRGDQPAAEGVTVSNASYLLVAAAGDAAPLVDRIGALMARRFGAFLLFEIAETGRDLWLEDDSPFLAPFDVTLSGCDGEAEAGAVAAALQATADALEALEVRYRTPRVVRRDQAQAVGLRPDWLDPAHAWARLEFAPVYRQPESEAIYPDLFALAVSNIFDAVLRGIHVFAREATTLAAPGHRALGRRVFIDAVGRADERIDAICASFDFLLAVTPINALEARRTFLATGGASAPRLLYRPLSVDVDLQKRRLFSIDFDQLEDPVLVALYREKQLELDVQLTMLRARGTPAFREAGRVLYGAVGDTLDALARAILRATEADGERRAPERDDPLVGCAELERRARAMIESVRAVYGAFEPSVEIRGDLPAGLMVSGRRLLISRDTRVGRSRVAALLEHEIGVHLLTYFTGEAQGLRLFRSGLAGYEGLQEGLAVFAEYAVGGMTVARMRLIAARVVACRAMLAGAAFVETYGLLRADFGLPEATAFDITLRVFRGGGLTKDAIYLRGLCELLAHLGAGGRLEPFWVGKIAVGHLDTVEELRQRGLLRAPAVGPLFLKAPGARRRVERARQGLTPTDLLAA